MLLLAAINGSRGRSDHPAILITPLEIANAAGASVRAGSGAVHFHIRGRDGAETLDPDALARDLGLIRAKVSSVPVGVTTGAWIEPDPADRLDRVRAWHAQPDFASVNFDEGGAELLTEALLLRGVDVEAGIPDARAAHNSSATGSRHGVCAS